MKSSKKTGSYCRYDRVLALCARRLFVCGDRENPKHGIRRTPAGSGAGAGSAAGDGEMRRM